MQLTDGRSRYYLRWEEFYLGSDSILVSFRHSDKREVLDAVRNMVPDYHSFVEKYVRDFYTIGGMMLFPQHRYSFNCARGCNKRICDRWDYTLECIRRYYQGGTSPLSRAMERDKEFFDLFVGFRDLWTFSSCRIVWMSIMRRSTCGWVRVSLRRILILILPVNILPG